MASFSRIGLTGVLVFETEDMNVRAMGVTLIDEVTVSAAAGCGRNGSEVNGAAVKIADF